MQRQAAENKWVTLEDGALCVEGVQLNLPGFRIIGELGHGANAIVFKATDERLQRDVAIKIWNNQGRGRAQAESSKIARFDHPLVVNTFYFDEVNGFPYAVMEFVKGSSGKLWVKGSPELEARIKVWKLYSEALHAIYSMDETHGDPHLGNILITHDFHGDLTLKVADAGTSSFRGDKEKLLVRESKIIHETAKRLFYDIDTNTLWSHPNNLNYRNSLHALDKMVEFLEMLTSPFTYDWKAQSSAKLVSIVCEVPLFNLDEMVRLLKTYAHIEDRFMLYLNQRLLNKQDIQDSYYTLSQKTYDTYEELQNNYLRTLNCS